MPSLTQQPCEYPLRDRRIAMLVIHGIGQQNPYETLDSFARGVFRYLKDSCPAAKLSALRTSLKDWTQVGIRIAVNTPSHDPAQEGYVDLFEYYWAPETEDKLNWKDTLKWLVLTDLTPLRFFADNLQEMMEAKDEPLWSRLRHKSFWSPTLEGSFAWAFWQSFKLYAREIARVVTLYIPLAIGLLWLLAWLANAPAIWDALKSVGAVVRTYPVSADVALAFCAFSVLMFWFALQSLIAYLGRNRFSIEKRAEAAWFVLALLCAACSWLLGYFFWSRHHVDLHALWAKVLTTNILHPLYAALLAAVCSYILTGYVADVAVYVTSDAKSKNYNARIAILKGSCDALKRLLVDVRYDYVILAGHSLGSVIAYDTINELLVQLNSVPGSDGDRPDVFLKKEQLQKLRGLVTFGSPLDKIYYFFRGHVKEDQAIRAQILSMLYSFRKIESHRQYGEFKFRYEFKQLDSLTWVNAYAHLDPVSARLKFYKLDPTDQKAFHYWIPGYAHLGYWGDTDFYDYFGEKLLLAEGLRRVVPLRGRSRHPSLAPSSPSIKTS